MSNAKIDLLLLAAGSSRRMTGYENKLLIEIEGKPLLAHALEHVARMPDLHRIHIVAREEDFHAYRQIRETLDCKDLISPELLLGGDCRRRSCLQGLEALALKKEVPQWVLVHDAARAFVPERLLRDVATSISLGRACAPTLPLIDTVRRMGRDGQLLTTFPRREMARMQTPQAFPFQSFLQAHRSWEALHAYQEASDDVEVYLAAGFTAYSIDGDEENRKITQPHDLVF